VIDGLIWHHKYVTTCIWTCKNNSEIMKISELFLHVQIQVVTYLWCQIDPSITGLVLTLVLSALSPGYAVFRYLIIRKSFFKMTWQLYLNMQKQFWNFHVILKNDLRIIKHFPWKYWHTPLITLITKPVDHQTLNKQTCKLLYHMLYLVKITIFHFTIKLLL
jgi:hypothetical protein